MSRSRALAAIMFADIVGYTATMQHDEATALSQLHRFKEVLEERAKEFDGKIIQYYGDAALIIFYNSTDAVKCAMVLQDCLRKYPEVPLRIGIHLGDFIWEGDNIFGDCVNISSRIQSMGVPGSILLSDAIKTQIKNQPEFQLHSLGSIEFKNVDEPIEVFALANIGFPVPDKANLQGKFKEIKTESLVPQLPVAKRKFKLQTPSLFFLGAIIIAIAVYFLYKYSANSQNNIPIFSKSKFTEKSIAVLPFVNMSGDIEQEYFADGLSEELINMFTKLPELKVIGRTSSFAFKGKNEDLRTIGKALNVEYILEGSIRKSGNTIRITTQLIKAKDGSHLWSEIFDRDLDDIFEIQEDISNSVVNALRITLSKSTMLAPHKTINVEAYNYFLRGKYFYELGSTDPALNWFKEAIKTDSSFSLPWTYMAACYWRKATNSKQIEFKEAKKAAIKAFELDPTSGIAAANLAELLDSEYDFRGALEMIDLALKLEPKDPYVLRNVGRFYTYLGRHKESIAFCQSALKNDPIQNTALTYLTKAYYYAEQYEDLKQTINKFKDSGLPNTFECIDAFIMDNNVTEAMELARKDGNENLELYLNAILANKDGKKEESEKILIQLIEKKPDRPYLISIAFASIGDHIKAMNWLEKAYAYKDKDLVYINVEPKFNSIRNTSRFKNLIKQMDFPK